LALPKAEVEKKTCSELVIQHYISTLTDVIWWKNYPESSQRIFHHIHET